MRAYRKRSKTQIEEDLKSQSRVCRNCDERKPFSDFAPSKQRADGVHSVCRSCCGEYHQEWRGKNLHRIRGFSLKSRYGITDEDYNQMAVEQDGECAICSTTDPGRGTYFFVDHCHTTGRVRGLLCHSCNTGIGHLRDDPVILLNALEYLGRHYETEL